MVVIVIFTPIPALGLESSNYFQKENENTGETMRGRSRKQGSRPRRRSARGKGRGGELARDSRARSMARQLSESSSVKAAQ
jgi:hypothetical protein